MKAVATKRVIATAMRVASNDNDDGNGGKSDGDGNEGAGQATTRVMAACYVMRNFGTHFTGNYVFLLVPRKSACCTIPFGIKIPVLEIQSRC